MRAEPLYGRLAPVYDAIYGVLLQPGRRRALARLAPQPGERVLEVGVGTGVGLGAYPAGCQVIGIDLSEAMIVRAHLRRRRRRLRHVSLCRMDARHLALPDHAFDAVYAPYLINVVPEPVAVTREILRVCRPGGRIVFLNHFDRIHGSDNLVNRLVGPIAEQLTGVNWHLDFREFLEATGLSPSAIEAVNIPRVSTVLLCRKASASFQEDIRDRIETHI